MLARPGIAWLLGLLACAAAALASAAATDVPGQVGLRLQRIGIEEGLSQSTARALAQDGQGMLWIGTQDGLNRFDGQDLRVFRHDPRDPHSLGDNHVTALYTDRDGVLWVGTSSGVLGRYDADALRFDNWPVGAGRDDAVAAMQVHAIAQAADGQLWVASGNGQLQRLDPQTRRFARVPVPAGVPVRALLPLPSGDMLIGTAEGLWRWSARQARLDPWAREAVPGSIDVPALAAAPHDRIWVGSSGEGAFELDRDGRRLRQLRAREGLAGDDVRALRVDRRERVWIGTYTGLSRVDAAGGPPQRWLRDRRHDGLGSERVHALLEDRDGLIWIGTWLGGVYLHLPGSEAFNEYRGVPDDARALPGDAVRAVLALEDGSLWLGVQDGGGLVRFDPAHGVVERIVHDPSDPAGLGSSRVQALARDGDGSLWIGFSDAGLDRRPASGGDFEHWRPDPFDPADRTRPRARGVMSLHVDREGTLWVGYAEAGLDMRCRGCDRFRAFEHDPANRYGLPGRGIAAVYESSTRELWVGGFPGGLARLDRASGQFTPVSDLIDLDAGGDGRDGRDPVLPRSVTTITEARNGELWIGSQGDGLLRLMPQRGGRYRARTYTHRDGLAADAVGSIQQDASGVLWVSTTRAISRLDPVSGTITNFDGRAGAQTEGYFINAGAQLPDGRIAFGGLRGLTVFEPPRVPARPALHAPVLTDLRVFESVRDDADPGWQYRHAGGDGSDRIVLRAGSGGFGFSFSALAFADPEQVQYSYRLDPLDREWIETGARQRTAGYPHLAPGDYTLRLRALRPGEAGDGRERRVQVTLAPLWWQSGWARAAMVLLLLAIVASWTWNRRQRRRERMLAQLELADSEQRLKLALWGTGDEFWDVDMRSRLIVRVNPLQHLRVSHEPGMDTLEAIAPYIHPDDLEGFRDAFRQHARGVRDDIDYVYRCQDVHGHWRWLRSRGRSVERGADGVALRMAGVTEDITELREHERTLEQVNQQLEERVGERTADLTRLNAELVKAIEQLRLTQHQLVESEKLAALGSLVAGIAHEVNTPLGVSVTAASHLEQQARLFAERVAAGHASAADADAFRGLVLDASAMVLRNLQRADRMIRSFKQVAVDQASEQPRRIGLRAYLDEILLSLQPTLKRSPHRLTIEVPADLSVFIPPGALYQIIVNLLMNALTHAFEGRERGEITIRAQREDDGLLLEFADDGSGMSEEVRRHLFEPFFTTRRGQGGSGLGMHIVYNLAVQALGGSIDCETVPGRGTRFVLRIPLPDA